MTFMIICGVSFKLGNSQQIFAKYCLCEAKLNSLFRSLQGSYSSLFFLIALSLQNSNPGPLSLGAGLVRVM